MKLVLSFGVWSAAGVLFGLLVWILSQTEPFAPSAAVWVREYTPQSGVKHEVTAVLLQFRALDTLLEVGVILLSLIAIETLSPHFRYKPLSFSMTLTDTFAAILLPLVGMSALYMLLAGSYKSGGAFVGAALLAGGMIIVRLVKPDYIANKTLPYIKLFYVIGMLLFVGIGALGMAWGIFLEYPKGYSGFWILFLESVLTLSLGAILASFFINATQRLGR